MKLKSSTGLLLIVYNDTVKKLLNACLVIFGCALLFYFLLLTYVVNKSEQDSKAKSDVILVLGRRAYTGDDYNPCLYARVQQAVTLYNDTYAPKILMSGGTDKEDNKNEAETMRNIAITLGVPANDILVETESTSTYENFFFSQKIIREGELNSIIIVTEPFHNARAELVAKKLDYTYTLSPTRVSPCWDDNGLGAKWRILKEPFALVLYKLAHKI